MICVETVGVGGYFSVRNVAGGIPMFHFVSKTTRQLYKGKAIGMFLLTEKLTHVKS